jgi:hypothetical protein
VFDGLHIATLADVARQFGFSLMNTAECLKPTVGRVDSIASLFW